MLLGNSDAGIRYADLNPRARHPLHLIKVMAKADSKRSSIGHRLQGIGDEIHENLAQLDRKGMNDSVGRDLLFDSDLV